MFEVLYIVSYHTVKIYDDIIFGFITPELRIQAYLK